LEIKENGMFLRGGVRVEIRWGWVGTEKERKGDCKG